MKNFKKLTLLMALASITSLASAGWFWSEPKKQLDLNGAISQLLIASVDTGLGLVKNKAQSCGNAVLAYMPEKFQSQVDIDNLVNAACVASIGLALGAAQQATQNETVAAAVETVAAGISTAATTLDKVSATLDQTTETKVVEDKVAVTASESMSNLTQALAERVEIAMPVGEMQVSQVAGAANRTQLVRVLGIVGSLAAVVAVVKNPTAVKSAFTSAMKYFVRK